jgi:hypothetical protein
MRLRGAVRAALTGYWSSLRLFEAANCLASQNAKTMPQTMNRM